MYKNIQNVHLARKIGNNYETDESHADVTWTNFKNIKILVNKKREVKIVSRVVRFSVKKRKRLKIYRPAISSDVIISKRLGDRGLSVRRRTFLERRTMQHCRSLLLTLTGLVGREGRGIK